MHSCWKVDLRLQKRIYNYYGNITCLKAVLLFPVHILLVLHMTANWIKTAIFHFLFQQQFRHTPSRPISSYLHCSDPSDLFNIEYFSYLHIFRFGSDFSSAFLLSEKHKTELLIKIPGMSSTSHGITIQWDDAKINDVRTGKMRWYATKYLTWLVKSTINLTLTCLLLDISTMTTFWITLRNWRKNTWQSRTRIKK